MRTIELPAGATIPVLGQGTWHMAEDPRRHASEVAALRFGLDVGMSLIDTAEMYGSGAAESLVGEAIEGRREEVFIVSKVLPTHATRAATIAACEASLRRLRTDRIDLYLLHWRGRTALEETLEGFEALVTAGKIRGWGVSNLDADDMEELLALPGGAAVQTNQVLYNLMRRGIEWDLLPLCRAQTIPMMGYSPIEQGQLVHHGALRALAARHSATPAQVALAWVIQQPGVCAVAKSATAAHVRENRLALDVHLTKDDLAELDRAFPPPVGPQPLEVL